jgi:quercetin dioxygenase-like cupin family protein
MDIYGVVKHTLVFGNMKLPFEEKIIDDKRLRTFSLDVDDGELKWHRDRENRLVEVIEGGDWYLQMDDELPKKLVVGEKYYIPEGVYHRVIKGNQELKVLITFV